MMKTKKGEEGQPTSCPQLHPFCLPVAAGALRRRVAVHALVCLRPHAVMPSSRLSLRLGQLPHDVLADLVVRLCSESPALQAVAKECMAASGSTPRPP